MTTTTETKTKNRWSVDTAHSEIGFRVKHMMITNVKGKFKEFEASINTSGQEFMTSDIEFRIKAASIDTADEKRDAHLKSADFFEVEKYKEIVFRGTSHETIDSERFILNGELTMRDITRPVKLDVEFTGRMKDPWGNEKVGYSINGKINRKEWGLNWNTALEAGGVLVSEDVNIICDVQLVKQ